jgi:hypothetical protein
MLAQSQVYYNGYLSMPMSVGGDAKAVFFITL